MEIVKKENQAGMTLIVKTITRLTVGLILLFGIYIVLHGHLSPGGGFAGWGRALLPIALIRRIMHIISTANWVIAKSGAFSMRKATESPSPTAPTAMTDESKSFVSTATIAATIMNIRRGKSCAAS